MKRTQTVSLPEIPRLAKTVAAELRGGETLALIGPLGAGKTTFVQALGRELGIRRRLTSPSFSLMHKFPARLPSKPQPVWLYHLDLYRSKNFREAQALGLEEFWGRPETITAIEWADKIRSHWPKKTFVFIFSTLV